MIDSSEASVREIVEAVPFARYYRAKTLGPQPIGIVRNESLFRARGEILVNMDDDDYYYPTRISCAVRGLQENRAQLAGVSGQINVDILQWRALKSGPFHAWHSSANMMAFTKAYARTHRFGEEAHNEEIDFTKCFHHPMIQLSQKLSGVCIMHGANTCNKYRNRKEIEGLTIDSLVPDVDAFEFYRNLSTELRHACRA